MVPGNHREKWKRTGLNTSCLTSCLQSQYRNRLRLCCVVCRNPSQFGVGSKLRTIWEGKTFQVKSRTRGEKEVEISKLCSRALEVPRYLGRPCFTPMSHGTKETPTSSCVFCQDLMEKQTSEKRCSPFIFPSPSYQGLL